MQKIDLNITPDMKIKQRFLVHTLTTKTHDDDEILYIKERVILEDGSNIPNLRMLINPTKKVYVTKKQHRTYTAKKEKERIDMCEVIECSTKDMLPKLQQAVNGFGRINKMSLFNNPYVYGADIDMESYYKIMYLNNNPEVYLTPDVAYLDIESDMAYGTGKINCLSLTHNGTSYSFINQEFFKKTVEDIDMEIEEKLKLDDIKELSTELIGSILRENNTIIKWIMCEDEKELLIKLFNLLHELKNDFICIWNMNYDIQEIIKAMHRNQLDPQDLFNDPNIPSNFKYLNYKEDGFIRDHYSLKWHWLYNPAHFQFIDSYTLYPWNRRTQTFEDKYSLDHILTVNGIDGKLFEINDHATFQKYRMDEYIIYNIVDTLNFKIGSEQAFRDIPRMLITAKYFPIKDYCFATTKLKNNYYEFYLKKGWIIASTLGKVNRLGEDQMAKVGGAVLAPGNATYTGLKNVADLPELRTMVSMLVNDGDFKSIYPTVMNVLNISNETIKYSPISIEGKDNEDILTKTKEVQSYFSKIIHIQENAVDLASKYFNLPTYTEIDNIIKQRE